MKITATNNDVWRLNRIEKTLRLARTMLNLTKSQLELLVEAVDDEKGLLTVYWRSMPTQHQNDIFVQAWSESEHNGQICSYPSGTVYGGQF